MADLPQKRNQMFWGKPFDLNKNGKIDPSEAALIMMIIDDVNTKKEASDNVIRNNTINIDDMDIKGIWEDVRLCRS